MGRETIHNKVLDSYVKHLILRDSLTPPSTLDITEACLQLQNDIEMFRKIQDSRYLNPRTSIPKDRSMHLAWEYAKDPAHHHLFVQMMHISPYVFAVVLELIKDHPVFCNNSNVPQLPVDFQLSVTLFQIYMHIQRDLRVPFGLSTFPSGFFIHFKNSRDNLPAPGQCVWRWQPCCQLWYSIHQQTLISEISSY